MSNENHEAYKVILKYLLTDDLLYWNFGKESLFDKITGKKRKEYSFLPFSTKVIEEAINEQMRFM